MIHPRKLWETERSETGEVEGSICRHCYIWLSGNAEVFFDNGNTARYICNHIYISFVMWKSSSPTIVRARKRDDDDGRCPRPRISVVLFNDRREMTRR